MNGQATREITMKRTIIMAMTLLLAGAARGQQTGVVEDTLDWHRYYPLEVGNYWDYGGLTPFIRTIVGDTLANGHRYFIQRDSTPVIGTVGGFVHTFYVRYDTAGTVVTLLDLEEDTLQAPYPVSYQRETSWDFLAHFDMRMAFGDTLYFSPPDTLLYAWGGYSERIEIGNRRIQYLEVDALKCFGETGYTVGWHECYATDIGLVSGGNLWGPDLQYALVNGIEYGIRPSTPVEAALDVPERFDVEGIYPNPFEGSAAIAYRLPAPSSVTVEVFTVLGRRIWREETPVQASGPGRYVLQRRGWPAGVYMIRLTTAHGAQAVRPVVVAR